tara:strand:- start:5 stop:286 length:282 start_codon:yes stop_codon:yes gene_type:complete
MNVKALPMSELLKECDDIYTTAMIIAQRSKQIIDHNITPIEEIDEVEDSMDLVEPEITIDDSEKPMVQALTEYLNNELEWRHKEDTISKTDES